MPPHLLTLLSLLILPTLSLAQTFPFESIQLQTSETTSYPAVAFGDAENPRPAPNECKFTPGQSGWPTDEEWDRFNETLGGALLKPRPLGTVCYEGDGFDAQRCALIKRMWSAASLHADNPISISTQWSEGHSCMPQNVGRPNATCRQGGYPVYVVNATTVRHIQLAVNFARNVHIRLVIKNTGHEFSGKSTGGYALSVWLHSIKHLKYLPNYTSPSTLRPYSGRAVAMSAGIQSLDTGPFARANNVTVISPGGSTVGNIGGFMMGGGHSGLTSFLGLAADHVEEMGVVTADGLYRRVSEKENADLYWAIRGGGGGTFAIVTSMVAKAFDTVTSSSSSIAFTTVPGSGTNLVVDRDVFWAGVKVYWEHVIKIVTFGGLGYNFIRHTPFPNNASNYGLTFTTSVSVPNMTAATFSEWVEPLYRDLRAVGIDIASPGPRAVKRGDTSLLPPRQYYNDDPPPPPTGTPYPGGNNVGDTRLASRFFSYANFNTSSALNASATAIQTFVEKGGYMFHGINYSPTLAVGGNPINAVNPAFRTTVMHAEGFDSQTTNKQVVAQIMDHERFQEFMQLWRDLTPGGGSYMNEGDAQEADWRGAFYGSNYQRLLGVKKRVDPWGLFYVVSGVGSEEWIVRGGEWGGGGR